MQKKIQKIFIVLFLLLLSACGGMSGTDSTNNDAIPAASPLQFNFDEKMKLAIGGTLTGWDQLLINNLGPTDSVTLVFEPEGIATGTIVDSNSNSITFKITPEKAGIAQLKYQINGVLQSKVIKVVIPPQEMIQVLMGEARSIIPQEITKDSEGRVDRNNASFTAQALLSVVRNRIKLMEERDEPSLFVVDSDEFVAADLAERYRLVIEANRNGIYQFSPVNPSDPSYSAYSTAAQRTGLSTSRMLVYDQALLTAADVFDESLSDNTQNSFGFYSPTKSEYENLLTGLDSTELPEDVGRSDSTFPSLAPIQILILENISPQTFDAELPSFVFVKSRSSTDKAVVKIL